MVHGNGFPRAILGAVLTSYTPVDVDFNELLVSGIRLIWARNNFDRVNRATGNTDFTTRASALVHDGNKFWRFLALPFFFHQGRVKGVLNHDIGFLLRHRVNFSFVFSLIEMYYLFTFFIGFISYQFRWKAVHCNFRRNCDRGSESMEERKRQHIDFSSKAQVSVKKRNSFFNYEPLFGTHPTREDLFFATPFLGQTLGAPLWISSMTGGTEKAGKINENLARACAEFSLGMGLGSCRSILNGDKNLCDFNLRPLLGSTTPFYANLGVAQVEELIKNKALDRVVHLVDRLKASGLIVHINPLQEWFQKEGDRFKRPPIEIVQELLEETSMSLIVKEVGQGMGPKSLRALMKLPLSAIEFGAFGGTNFSRLESMRDRKRSWRKKGALALVGHDPVEMITHINRILERERETILCEHFIISGGIRSTLTGLQLMKLCRGQSIFAMARPFLDAALEDYKTLREFVLDTLEEMAMARAFLDGPIEEV